MIRRDPIGVVASIAPLELPADDGGLETRPGACGGQHRRAEAVGTDTAHCVETRRTAEIFPAGVVNIVCGRGRSVGVPLTKHPKVRMISLTGDVATGGRILAQGRGRHQAHAPRARAARRR